MGEVKRVRCEPDSIQSDLALALRQEDDDHHGRQYGDKPDQARIGPIGIHIYSLPPTAAGRLAPDQNSPCA